MLGLTDNSLVPRVGRCNAAATLAKWQRCSGRERDDIAEKMLRTPCVALDLRHLDKKGFFLLFSG